LSISAIVGELQARLYAENQHSLLIVLQAMDTGGKDGTIKHVFQGVNPKAASLVIQKPVMGKPVTTLWRYSERRNAG